MRLGAVALVIVACDGTSSRCEAPEPSADGCFFDGSIALVSVDEMECGLGPSGRLTRCPWRVTLDDGAWSWRYSDVSEQGTYRCLGDTVVAEGRSLEGVWVVDEQRLLWDGVEYEVDCDEVADTE